MKKDSTASSKWTYKEFTLLLLLTLVFVPFFVEYLLHSFLLHIFKDRLYSGTATGFLMAIVFTLGVYFIALKPHHLKWFEIGLCRFTKSYWKSIIYWIFILIVTNCMILMLMYLFHIGVENTKTESLQRNITWFTFSIAFISAAIISPIYEEIFYRGFLYKWMKLRWGVRSGILFSSLIFTIVHIPTYNTLPVNFISGLVFAWTYEKSGSIIPAMIIHSVLNGIAVILTVL